MEEDAGITMQLGRQLWSMPMDHHNADDDNDEAGEELVEELYLPELEAHGKHSHLLRMTSKEVPADISRSGRLYQTAQLSVLEFSAPTMSTRSQWSSWSSSPRPLQRRQAPWPSSLIHTASHLHSLPRSTSSNSLKTEREHSPPVKSTGKSGLTPLKINSGSFTKETGTPQSQRVPSGSPFKSLFKTRNR
uniref:P4 movement protein n=1 Tax=Cynanchum yellow mottle-associated virus TaxID=2926297 RepID=A0AA48GDS0_9VIRU|nr:P4 movement protein [Cynanchum yellow mottle-associated virus]